MPARVREACGRARTFVRSSAPHGNCPALHRPLGASQVLVAGTKIEKLKTNPMTVQALMTTSIILNSNWGTAFFTRASAPSMISPHRSSEIPYCATRSSYSFVLLKRSRTPHCSAQRVGCVRLCKGGRGRARKAKARRAKRRRAGAARLSPSTPQLSSHTSGCFPGSIFRTVFDCPLVCGCSAETLGSAELENGSTELETGTTPGMMMQPGVRRASCRSRVQSNAAECRTGVNSPGVSPQRGLQLCTGSLAARTMQTTRFRPYLCVDCAALFVHKQAAICNPTAPTCAAPDPRL